MFWAIAVMVGVPAVIVISQAIRHHREQRLLRTSGVRSSGRILELSQSDDGVGNVSRWAKVEYSGYGGYTETATVYLRHELSYYHVGQRVSLTYVPGDSIVRLDS